MDELDEALRHTGVKGMKWGVRKTVTKAGKAIARQNSKRHERNKQILTTNHNKHINNKKYAKDYGKALKRTGNKYTAMRTAQVLRKHRSERNARVALSLGLVGASAASKFLARPETIRAGKNIVNVLKNSPVRYVDGSTFTNVINAAMPLARR